MDEILIALGRKILEGNLIIISTIIAVAVAISIYYIHKIISGKIEKTNNEEISSQVENSISLIVTKINSLEKAITELITTYKKDLKLHDTTMVKNIADIRVDITNFIDKSRADILHKIESDNAIQTNTIYNHIDSALSDLEATINNDLISIRVQRTGVKEELINLNVNILDIKKAIDLLNTLNNNIRLMPLKNNVPEE